MLGSADAARPCETEELEASETGMLPPGAIGHVFHFFINLPNSRFAVEGHRLRPKTKVHVYSAARNPWAEHIIIGRLCEMPLLKNLIKHIFVQYWINKSFFSNKCFLAHHYV